ncbi:hypothetical protein F4860DRAFT_458677 [Xylaria cubensis]|nr:hypothetical protein F4860DRAFT_458677 [Xylaria cubensis]
MLTYSLISPALRASIRGASLTWTHPNLHAPSTPSNILRKINTCTIRCNSIGSGRSLTTGARFTSTSVKKDVATNAIKNGSPSQSGPRSQQTSSPSEDDFKISFHNLGMNRITKFVVFAVIGVLGTMETIFWCKVLWRWWTGNEEDTDE